MKIRIRMTRKSYRAARIIARALGWLLFAAMGAAPYIILIAQLGK